jgi:hypothetical protein
LLFSKEINGTVERRFILRDNKILTLKALFVDMYKTY